MAVFTCKMCGGSLEIQQDSLIAVCEYCGTKQTLPRLDNEQKMHLYDRQTIFAAIMNMTKQWLCMRP